ncbi:PqqD family protein [Cellulosimicrobium sp. PMB13]|uniref:PqqD family peptide modification chaperone n=1 Tax=Cellulosimicrobium sp. PMB13 TaxID=3120158 RepID=UPI003F4C2B64
MRRRAAGSADRFSVAPEVTVSRDGDDVTFFQARTGRYWRGNETAARVVELLGQGRTVGEVVDDLAAAYGVDRDVVHQDAVGVVRSLVTARVLAPTAGTR